MEIIIFYQSINYKTTKMNPNKIDTVHGYLTPKRMLTSLMNPSQKNKVNRSLTNSLHETDNIDESQVIQNSTPRKQRQSYKKKNEPQEPLVSSETDNFYLHDHKSNKSYEKEKQIPVNPSAPNINNQNQQNISQRSRNSRESSRIRSNRAGTEAEHKNLQKQSREYDQRQADKKTEREYQHSQHSNVGSTPSKRFLNLNKNPDMAKLLIQQTINKLNAVKKSLEQQITELKGLLDNISDTIVNMDYEFEKIKQAFLLHTSRSLDSAFKQYKKNLSNLNLYQNVEGDGLNKISEINQTIEICNDQQKLRIFGGREAIQKKAHQYKIFTEEVKKAKKQCYSQKPMISEQKIKKFEAILKQISQF